MQKYPFKRLPARFNPAVFVVLLVAAVGTLTARMAETHGQGSGARSEAAAAVTGVRVAHVTDGDTLKLSSRERVRLIGIDTPEVHESVKLYRDAERTGQDIKTIQRMGREASRFTRELVEGKVVRLEFDVQQRDRYGRLLAYVYLEDGTFVNAQIIKNGYAYPLTVPPNTRHADEFQALFAEARRAGVGLWAVKGPAKDRHEPSR